MSGNVTLFECKPIIVDDSMPFNMSYNHLKILYAPSESTFTILADLICFRIDTDEKLEDFYKKILAKSLDYATFTTEEIQYLAQLYDPTAQMVYYDKKATALDQTLCIVDKFFINPLFPLTQNQLELYTDLTAVPCRITINYENYLLRNLGSPS